MNFSNVINFQTQEMKDMIRRAKALRFADGEYVNYAGITEGTKGSVRFLIETGKIENN